jgi:hypothetical protein
MITHVVVFWTDKPYGENREKLLEGTRMLGKIPGVLEYHCGRAVSSSRAVVDDSFAVAISMSFASQADAGTYQSHPIHHEFIEQYVKPLAKRFVVYDFE